MAIKSSGSLSFSDITKIDMSDCETQEEMKVKVMQAYHEMVSVAPSNVRLAFREVLQ